MTTYESASEDLLAAVDRVIEPWLVRIAMNRLTAVPSLATPETTASIAQTARHAHGETVNKLRAVVLADVDEQPANPLQVLRGATDFMTAVLRQIGVPFAARDEYETRINPDDVYGLYPAHWSDVDESLTESGIVWGAAKAATVLQRRRAEGKLES